MSDLLSKLVKLSNIYSFEVKVPRQRQNMHKYELGKQLPKDYAQQILENDIILVLSEFTNNDALRNLINLYMLGVEHFKEIQDQSYEYFQIKLNKIILNPIVTSTSTTHATNEKIIESPVVKKKPAGPPKLVVNFEQEKEQVQHPSYSQTAAVVRETSLSSFQFTEDVITETVNGKLKNHHNETVSVDFDGDKSLNFELQNRIQSQQDERKENLTLDLKQQLFLFDENKETSEIIDQYKNQQEKRDKFKKEQLNKQNADFRFKLSQRLKKKNNTQIVPNMNRYNSQPNFLNKPMHNSEQREQDVIFEDKNESSSKITSSEKNTSKFQFEEQ